MTTPLIRSICYICYLDLINLVDLVDSVNLVDLVDSVNLISLNRPVYFVQLALRSPTATGSPFGRSLAPWFGPDFEIFRFFDF